MMKHNLWYKVVRCIIQHSTAGMTYVVEMRNEVAENYEYEIEYLKKRIEQLQRRIEMLTLEREQG